MRDSNQQFLEDREESLAEISARYQAQRQPPSNKLDFKWRPPNKVKSMSPKLGKLYPGLGRSGKRWDHGVSPIGGSLHRLYTYRWRLRPNNKRLANQAQVRAAQVWLEEARVREVNLEEARVWVARQQVEANAREQEDARAQNLRLRQIQGRERICRYHCKYERCPIAASVLS